VIEFSVNTRGVKVDQWCDPPTVYLDHWAWRRISESSVLVKRFSAALKSQGGTLVFSWLNLIEFSKVSDEQQARKADAFLDEILPHVFILNPNFFRVIEAEDELLNGGVPIAPHADLVSLKFFAKHNLTRHNSLKLLPSQNLFGLTSTGEISAHFDGFADQIVGHIESLRHDFNASHEFSLAVKRIPKGQPTQCGTRYIARELLGSMLMNKSVKADRHHAIDICHAVVPVAYCDYVLLDGHWATQVERARKRIKDGGLLFPIAKVYSEKRDGLESFFRKLEGGMNGSVPSVE